MNLPMGLISNLKKKIPLVVDSEETVSEIVQETVKAFEEFGMQVVRPGIIETRSIKQLLAQIQFACESLKNGDTAAARETLQEAEITAKSIVSWLQHNMDFGAQIPVTWSEHIAAEIGDDEKGK